MLQVDVKKIKQLQDLLEIVGELEDKINSGEDPDDDPETDSRWRKEGGRLS